MFKKLIHIIFYLLFAIHLFAQQTEIKYLSGTGNDSSVKWDFFCTNGMNANKWTTIAVPSCWELQGFGKYNYGFAKDSARGKEKGFYKHEFTVSSAWKNKQINLVFEGVMTDAEVTINGVSAGAIHQGAFYSFKYDITKLLKFAAKNLLEVTVAKHSANTSVNEAERKADFWILGGIFRPVFLEALPKQHIETVMIDAKADGNFSVEFTTNQKEEIDAIEFKIFDSEGNIVELDNSESVRLEAIQVDDLDHEHHSFAKYANIKPWSPEAPNLYKAVFTLNKNGKPIHSISQKFGFRTVELKHRDGIYVNGVKVKMKGVNRHSFRPETGRTLSKENSIEDVILMKDMNMNAVRMSHYPPDAHFLDVCDSLGLFVMDELAGWHGNYDTETGKKLVKEMLEHDRNHPSIIFWSNGNEGGHNLELDDFFYEFDLQKRPVIHPWQNFGGFDTQHYREYNYGIGNYENGREIVMPTEFLHGQFDGGHGAGLEDYWEKMWHNSLSAGGFLWDFADQAVVRKDLHDSLDTDKFRGADGILGPHHEKEGSYFAIKEIWSPIHFEQNLIGYFFDGKLNLENRYHYTNINQCSFTWQLKNLQTNSELKSVAIAPNILPNAKGFLQLALPDNWLSYDVLYVTAKDAFGRELFTWSFPIASPQTVGERLVLKDKKTNGIITAKEVDSLLIVTVKSIQIIFNRNNGLLVNIKNSKGDLPFNNGPIIQEATNNFKQITYYFKDSNLVIESAFDKKESYNTLQWTIQPNGWIKLQVQYFPSAYFTNFVGLNFSLPENEIQSVTYMGVGPYRVWKNRMKGQQFGIWTKTYNNTETGEFPWKYPEFKGYHANFYEGTFVTKTNQFKVVTETEDVFLRLFTPAWKTDQWHNYEPIFPSGDISFMQGISSIGSKTQRSETTGSMGQKNIFYDYEKDPTRALKMVLYFDFNGQL